MLPSADPGSRAGLPHATSTTNQAMRTTPRIIRDWYETRAGERYAVAVRTLAYLVVMLAGLAACPDVRPHDAPPVQSPPPLSPAQASSPPAQHEAPSGSPPIAAAASDQPVDGASPAAPLLNCDARPRHTMGWLDVKIDPTTLKGEVRSLNTSQAPSRHLHVIAEPHDGTTRLLFDGYFDGDHSFKGTYVPRTEKLVRGKSVVARLVLDGPHHDEPRLYLDGDVDLGRGFKAPTLADGWLPCW